MEIKSVEDYTLHQHIISIPVEKLQYVNSFTTDEYEAHDHLIRLSGSEIQALLSGEEIEKDTTIDASHKHTFLIKLG